MDLPHKPFPLSPALVLPQICLPNGAWLVHLCDQELTKISCQKETSRLNVLCNASSSLLSPQKSVYSSFDLIHSDIHVVFCPTPKHTMHSWTACWKFPPKDDYCWSPSMPTKKHQKVRYQGPSEENRYFAVLIWRLHWYHRNDWFKRCSTMQKKCN